MNSPRRHLTDSQRHWVVFVLVVAVVCVLSAFHGHLGGEHIYTPTEVCESDWNAYGIRTGESHGYYMAVCEQNLKTELRVREQQSK